MHASEWWEVSVCVWGGGHRHTAATFSELNFLRYLAHELYYLNIATITFQRKWWKFACDPLSDAGTCVCDTECTLFFNLV